jgi:hypothetical protein
MSPKPSPFTDLVVPLTRGGVEPADISVFKGIQFAARGDGDYSILFDCYGARKVDWPAASFAGKAKWKTVRIPFTSFQEKHPTSLQPLHSVRALHFHSPVPPE